MAPLPENNTPRLKVTYQNAIADHDVVFRMVANTDVDALEAAIDNLLDAAGPEMHFAEVTNVQFAADGSDLFFPRSSSPLLGKTFGSGAATVETNARFWQFGGRSTGGRRTKAYLYGYKGLVSDWRLSSSEDTDVAAVVAILNADAAIFTAIDGLATTWYPYANINYSDHWVKETRA